MGTSASSSGPGSGVPLVPPWVPDPKTGEPFVTPQNIAPAARFGNTRRQLRDFARTGNINNLQRALRHYVKTGLGGARSAVQRMGGAVSSSGSLYEVLRLLTPADLNVSAAALAKMSSKEIIDKIVQLISSSDGIQDTEASQRSIDNALSDLVSKCEDSNEEIDFSALSELQISWVIQRHLVYEIHQRISSDVGKTIVDNSPSPSAAIDRYDEMRAYIEEKVAALFRRHFNNGESLTKSGMISVVNRVMEGTFTIFEEYVK